VKKNGFAPIIIILVIAILGVVGYFSYKIYKSPNQPITQPTTPSIPPATPDTTANWKTYINNQYGFELKYPQDDKVEEIKDPGMHYFSIPHLDQGTDINFFPSDSNFKTNKPFVDSDILKQENIEFNNLPAKHITVDGPNGRQMEYLLVGQNQKYFIISYEDFDNLSSQILSTFKFTK
jgi:hypothetical protein